MRVITSHCERGLSILPWPSFGPLMPNGKTYRAAVFMTAARYAPGACRLPGA